MIKKAVDAIDNQDTSERFLYGTSFAISYKNYSRVCSLIEKFHADIHQIAQNSKADEVYRVNTQFFRLTEPIQQSNGDSE